MTGRGPDARETARRVLRRVETGSYATLALTGELDRAGLTGADRALATELVYGVLRHRARLDRALAAMAPRGLAQVTPVIMAALRVGAYQLLFLDRIPAHAAVDDAVSAASRVGGARVGGFVNAVLRRLGRDGEPPLPPSGDPAWAEAAWSMPAWIVDRLRARLPAAELPAAIEALSQPPPVALRVSTPRTDRAALLDQLRAERPDATVEASPLSGEAALLRGGGDPRDSASFRAGLWTVQDVGAQLAVRLLGAAPGQRVLDACAGVGGKATHLAQIVGPAGRVDAADLSARKLALLAEAARRLGATAVHPVEADLTDPAAAGLAARYDAILLDAPCSGLGVLRRHPEAKWRPPPDVAALAALQARLLDALVPRLAPGGVLVYAVCTFTREEGPDQIAALLARHSELAPSPPPAAGDVDWAAVASPAGELATWPHRHGADGFYAARLVTSSAPASAG